MPLFLSDQERKNIGDLRRQSPVAEGLYWNLLNRAERRASSPVSSSKEITTEWWHHTAEFLTDAALAHALKASPKIGAWLRSSALALARRPVDDWIGPSFRDHSRNPPIGHLETAHLSWGLSVVLDLAPDIFTETEHSEVAAALQEKAIPLCLRWLEQSNNMANWRCVLNAGLAAASVVAGDAIHRKMAEEQFRLCQQIFQEDGSHGESLQYGNYAAYAQMLTWESLTRFSPELASVLPMEPYSRMPVWQACSLFYKKPLSGWGSHPRARSANFNDSAALFRPSADLLLHISARNRKHLPQEAGLARWLFDTLYTPVADEPPHDLASFGFVNDFGFLSLPLLTQAAAALSPEDAGLPLISGFSCGDMIARDSWNGRTVLAVHGAGAPLNGPGHLHGDLNSFILVHNRERLLADPGHSCYRNLIHKLDTSSPCHNTCTFILEAGNRVLEQAVSHRRHLDLKTGRPNPPVDRGGRQLLMAREDDVSVLASEASSLYGDPITEFSRFWFLCGSNVLFIADRITSATPVRTTWNWVFNNRDGQLDLKVVPPDRLVARRGEAGMKFFHLGEAKLQGPFHGHLHDAYHPLPNQLGEGKSDSARILRWTEEKTSSERCTVHALCMDHYGSSAGWHLKTEEGYAAVLEGPQRSQLWKLKSEGKGFMIEESISARRYTVKGSKAAWKLEKS